jgi:hypothetical protein
MVPNETTMGLDLRDSLPLIESQMMALQLRLVLPGRPDLPVWKLPGAVSHPGDKIAEGV